MTFPQAQRHQHYGTECQSQRPLVLQKTRSFSRRFGKLQSQEDCPWLVQGLDNCLVPRCLVALSHCVLPCLFLFVCAPLGFSFGTKQPSFEFSYSTVGFLPFPLSSASKQPPWNGCRWNFQSDIGSPLPRLAQQHRYPLPRTYRDWLYISRMLHSASPSSAAQRLKAKREA